MKAETLLRVFCFIGIGFILTIMRLFFFLSVPLGSGKKENMYFDVKEVGARIRALRMERNLTQAEMAEALNISLEHYKRIETGRRGCSIDILISLKMYFGVSLDYLVLGETPDVEVEQIRSELEDVIGRLSQIRKVL